MKLWRKDGGAYSNVWGLYIPEIKSLFSVVLLKFTGKSRDSYHSHAFNSIAWVLRGRLIEETLDGRTFHYTPSWRPFFVSRDRTHRVHAPGTAWVLNLRGPWLSTWYEYFPVSHPTYGYKRQTLTHGRQPVG